jgi:cobalt-zinc-cadmium efflux system outer membrane protein
MLTVAGDEGPGEPPSAEETLVARALTARPDLAAAREERARLETEADLVHRRGRVPNPTFEGFYRQEVGDERIAGARISVPLPLWNRQQGAEAELRAQALAAAAEADRLLREIPRQVHLAVVRRATAAAAWERYQRQALPAAGTVRELLDRAFGTGYLGLPEVLVQQDRLVQVRSAAIGAWLDLREAEADLIEAVGEEGE